MHTDNYIQESVELLKQMVSIPSPSFEESMVREHISNWLTDKKICHEVIKNNILAFNSRFCKSKQTLMLCAHIDTVSPGNDYSFDPYNPDYEQAYRNSATSGGNIRDSREKVFGLGSNDDGASAVAMISAFRHFYNEELPVNLMIVLSAEEERSGKDGMSFIWANLENTPDWAIVGEPTRMQAATSERGLLVIDATSYGTSGHAARGDGDNAIYIAMEDIERLRSHKFSRISEMTGQVHLNVTQINAGTVHNVIPDQCSFVIDIRPTEQYTNEEILNELSRLCRSRLTARNLANRSSATRPDSPLVRCAGELGIEVFSSPTTSDWMRIGCDAIKMGPGDSSRSHKKDEFVYVSEIEQGIRKYIDFIETFIQFYI